MLSKFAKYHGLGNDFIIIAELAPALTISGLQKRAPALCDRHTGIGADGILVLSTKPEYLAMTVINADGSLALNCGNGLRCAARWYFDHYSARAIAINLGNKEYVCEAEGENIRVAMGECQIERLRDRDFLGPSLPFQVFKASLANEHLIAVYKEAIDWQHSLKEIQKAFPDWQDYNVGFVFAHANAYESRVFERGVGWTQSCGSGACVAACALVAKDAGHRQEFTLCQPGGDIMVSTQVLGCDDRLCRVSVSQVGKATGVFHGNLCQ